MGDIDDDFCLSNIDDSDIRDGCARFRLTIRTWIHFHVKGTQNGASGRVFSVDDWTSTEQTTYKDKFKLQIETAFGDGAIWLVHTKKGTRDLWCDVKIEYVSDRDNAHLVVNAVNNPNLIAGGGPNYYRGTCEIGGVHGSAVEGGSSDPELNKSGNRFDMHMPNGDVVNAPTSRSCTTTDSGTVTISQTTLWHEFGHYLGLRHKCDGEGEGYCDGKTKAEQEDLMAVGNTFTEKHAAPFRDRLSKHNYPSQGWFDPVYFVFPVLAKGINSGSPDRNNRPWLGTPMEKLVEALLRS